MNFDKRSTECADKLAQIKRLAEEGQRSRSSATKELLDSVISQVDSAHTKLQFWYLEAQRGQQTNDRSRIQSVNALFEQLEERIEAARRALKLRLDNRRLLGRGWGSKRDEEESNLKDDLARIHETVGRLQSSIKSILDDPEDQRLRERINRVDQTQTRRLDQFALHIGNLPVEERTNISLGSLALFWEGFPPPLNLTGRAYLDPGDGTIFTQKDVDEAETVLGTFCHAWKGEVPKDNPPWALSILPNMGKVCLILNTINRREWLDIFLNEPYTDHDLPINDRDLKMCLPDQEASLFLAEQYRAVPREWPTGKHIKVADEEPLPLRYQFFKGAGSYSIVDQVQDPFTDIVYVRKKQKLSDDGSSEEQFQNEIDKLRKLHHPHIVQFVKSYERGTQYGMLLQPVAKGDLWKLFERWQKEPQARRWIEEMLLKMFGCLTRALVYIHKSMRHKDIKPQNVLWLRESADEDGQFLWADFGLAYDFSSASDSKTQSTIRFSPRYAAPEYIKPSEATQLHHMSTEHGTKSDIFSFGLIFLETLSVIIGEGILQPQPEVKNLRPNKFQGFATKESSFSDNIPEIQAWVDRQLSNLDRGSKLRVLFNLGRRMIQEMPEDRPDIDDILNELWTTGSTFFCPKCVKAMRQERPRSTSPPSPPSGHIVRPPPASANLQLTRTRSEVEWSVQNELKPPQSNVSRVHNMASMVG